MNIQQARQDAENLTAAFEQQCVLCGYEDQWDAYRKHDAGETWPVILEVTWQRSRHAWHEFYTMRDGPDGFLGGRGI